MLAGLLVDKVAQAGTERETYLALQRLGVLGDAAAEDRYVGDLVDWLDLDARTAAELADSLVAAGLLPRPARTVRIADDGAQLRAKIAGSISAVTAPIYESLEPVRRRDDRPHPALPHHAGAGAERRAGRRPAEKPGEGS